MNTIERFEDRLAWHEARFLTREIHDAARKAPLKGDFSLRDHCQRAAVSVMLNLGEGFERTGRREKLRFMNIARASCAEVKSLLYVCLDNNPLDGPSVTGLQSRCTQISRLLSGLIRSVSTRIQPTTTGSDSEH